MTTAPSIDQAFAKITSEATRDAMLAKQEYEIEAQRERVDHLTVQVKDRTSTLRSLLYEVDARPDRYPYGAVLRDGKALDELLAALTHEADKLREMEAANNAALRLTEKYQAEVDGIEVPADVPVRNGQYL